MLPTALLLGPLMPIALLQMMPWDPAHDALGPMLPGPMLTVVLPKHLLT